MASAGWTAAAFASVGPALAGCAGYALLAARRHARRSERAAGPGAAAAVGDGVGEASADSAEDFITARGSVDVSKLAFSLYASAMGSWVVTGPAIYASEAGLLGLASYSVAAGFPLVAVALLGGRARAADPEASSLPDFLRRRFGGGLAGAGEGRCGSADGATSNDVDSESTDSDIAEVAQAANFVKPGSCIAAFSAIITLFNMCVAMLAEYSTIGTLFRSFVGVPRGVAVLPTVLVALLTISYTVVGGLYVSILTDRVQAIFSLVLVALLAVFLAADFPEPPGGLPPLTNTQRGFTYSGYSSLLTMPLSLTCSLLYSEAIWQRVWAAEADHALRRASHVASCAVSIVVAFFGFVGFLACWAGRTGAGVDPNLYFFVVFSSSVPVKLDSIPGLLALLCAAVMSEGAVDSMQNGITATLSSTLLKGRPLSTTRLLVLVVNIPLALLGASPLVDNVLSLFLLANMASVACAPPLALALLGGQARELVTEGAVVFGCLGGLLGTSIYGMWHAGSVAGGLRLAWMTNGYGWDYFLAALLSSLACSVLGIAVGALCRVLSAGVCAPRHARRAASQSSSASA